MPESKMDDALIGEVNTTPLIDVMLVLLIMFIITIPMQSHAVKVDLPAGGPVDARIEQRNKLVVTADGRVMWNGQAVNFAALRGLLGGAASLPTKPELHIEPEAEARYELVDQVLAEVKRANVTALGFVGNERYAVF